MPRSFAESSNINDSSGMQRISLLSRNEVLCMKRSYRCDAIRDLKRDMEDTLEKCIPVTKEMLKTSLLQRFICTVVRIFAPML